MGLLLGAPAQLVTLDDVLDEVSDSIARRAPSVFVGVYPALSLTALKDKGYRGLLRASRLYPDGMGAVWALRRQGIHVPRRLATTDIVWDIAERAQAEGWRLMLYGAAPGVAHRAAARLEARFPKLEMVAVIDGYARVDQGSLSTFAPDLVLVGRGAPLQEYWAHQIAKPAGVPAILTCGGLFDFLASEVKRAPLWMQRLGLEWLYRVAQDPRRLLVRYALGNPTFIVWSVIDRLSAGGVRRADGNVGSRLLRWASRNLWLR